MDNLEIKPRTRPKVGSREWKVTVTTVAGPELTHTYLVPEDHESVSELFREVWRKVFAALTGNDSTLLLENPLAAYKGSQLVSVTTEVKGPEHVKREIEEQMKRQIGFIKT